MFFPTKGLMRNKRKVHTHRHTHTELQYKVDRVPKIWLRQLWRAEQTERTKRRSIFSNINETLTFTPVTTLSNDILSCVSGALHKWAKLITPPVGFCDGKKETLNKLCQRFFTLFCYLDNLSKKLLGEINLPDTSIFVSHFDFIAAVSLGRTLTEWHIWTLEHLPTRLCCIAPNQSDHEGISCSPPPRIIRRCLLWFQSGLWPKSTFPHAWFVSPSSAWRFLLWSFTSTSCPVAGMICFLQLL